MQEPAAPVIKLDYPSARAVRPSRLAAWVRRLPHWTVALGMTLGLMILDHFGFWHWLGVTDQPFSYHLRHGLYFIALLIPGAIVRTDWRHLLVMLPLAGLAYGLEQADSWWAPELPFPYSLLVWPIWAMLMVGLGEWLLCRPRSGRGLIWIAVSVVAAVCLFRLLLEPLGYVGWPGEGRAFYTTSSDYLHWPLLAALTWIAIPVALRLGRQASRRQFVTASGVAAAVVASFLLFFHVLAYTIARYSLTHDGPFARTWAASLVGHRGGTSDRQAMWEALENADWSQREDGSWDYRKTCVEALAQLDRPAAAARLSEMLRERPSRTLAAYAADALAAERWHEAVPVLLRYALLSEPECIEALEVMEVPEAALAVIRQNAVWNELLPRQDLELYPPERQRLVRIFGQDVGPNLSDWITAYDAGAAMLPTPLSDEQAQEADQVVATFLAFCATADLHLEGRSRLFIKRMKDAGFGQPDEVLELAHLRLIRGARRYIDAVGAEEYARQVRDALAVPSPDWDVRTTEELEAEVTRYAARVEAILVEHGVAPEPPATAPTSAPATKGD